MKSVLSIIAQPLFMNDMCFLYKQGKGLGKKNAIVYLIIRPNICPKIILYEIIYFTNCV